MSKGIGNYWTNIVDGQELTFCSVEEWGRVVNKGRFQKIPISDFMIKQLTSLLVPLVRKYENIELGILADTFEDRHLFKCYTLVAIGDDLQRIDIVGHKCSNCDWQGLIGTPLSSDIYFGISKENTAHELMRRSRKYPNVTCPRCGTNINRFAIWIGDFPSV
ncbi:hypothetical protein [Lewinella sp. LCG006]|uniref:hypothetical protein n=1 Tax=Lewinella sp. LCG006 TaxID=3231911 RepID=UPI00346061B7